MAKEPEKVDTSGTMTLTSNTTPIGMLDDGALNVVDKNTPPWKPKVFDADGNEIDPDAIEPDAPTDE